MPPITFFRQLSIVSVLTAIVLFGLNQWAALSPYQDFSWISLAFFVLLTLAMYGVGTLTAKSKQAAAFTGTILGFTFAKMLFSLVIVIVYFQYMKPSSKVFVIPFFIVYLVYTAFETSFMMKLGKNTKS